MIVLKVLLIFSLLFNVTQCYKTEYQQCFNSVAANYFTNAVKTLTFILGNSYMENVFLHFYKNNSHPVLVFGNFNMNLELYAIEINVITLVQRKVELRLLLNFIKRNNFSKKKIQLLLLLANKTIISHAIDLVKREDFGTIILTLDNNDLYIFKATDCNISNCYWDSINITDLNLHCKNINLTVINNNISSEFSAVISNFRPYIIDVQNNTSSNTSEGHGVEFNLLNLISSLLNISITYLILGEEFVVGDVLENGTVTGQMQFLDEKVVDIAMGSHTLNVGRSSAFFFVFPYVQHKIVWCVPHKLLQTNLSLDTIFEIRSIILLLLLLFVFILIIIITQNHFRKEIDQRKLEQTIFNVYAIFIGVPSKLPRENVLRIIVALIILLNLFSNIFYSTALVSSLTHIQFTEKYGTMEMLLASDLVPYAYPTNKKFYQGTIIFNRLKSCTRTDKCLNDVATKQKSAYALGALNHRLVVNKYKSKNNVTQIYCMKSGIMSFPLSFFMRRGFPYHKQFSYLTMRIIEAGFILKFFKDLEERTEDEEKTPSFLKYEHLYPVFVLLFWCHVTASTVFVTELITFKFRYSNKL